MLKYYFILLCMTFIIAEAGIIDDEVQEIIRQRAEDVRTNQLVYQQDASLSGIMILPELYENRDFKPVWTNSDNIDGLFKLIREMELEGLNPADYHLEELSRLKNEISSQENPPAKLIADYDLRLSDALVRIVYHLVFGKVDPEKLDPNWNMYQELKEKNPVEWFQATIDRPDIYTYINNVKPDMWWYSSLRDGLARYRLIEEQGGWPVIPAGKTLKPGMEDDRMPILRERLVITEDLQQENAENPLLFDESLENGIKRFQKRHGLNPDAAIGKNTLEALNVPVESRIDQLLINLERGRWIYRNTDPEYIIVNIASFYVKYADFDTLMFQARAQVGKDKRKTPVFKANLEYIVFNPTWTVPPTILKKDVLPAIKRDPAYLNRKNMKVVNRQGQIVDPAKIDWAKYPGANFPYSIRQDPGPRNALGRVKFIFPNKHFVFLHDTPSKSLFDREIRTFSSGCIRVENPFKLAEALLIDKTDWTREKIDEVIKSKKTKTVYLNRPVSVFILYATAFPNLDDNSISFIKDVYKRDAALLKSLQEPFKRKNRHLISE